MSVLPVLLYQQYIPSTYFMVNTKADHKYFKINQSYVCAFRALVTYGGRFGALGSFFFLPPLAGP